MSDPAILAVQGVAVAVVSALASVIVARLSKRAKHEETQVSQQTAATEAWRGYAEKMETRLDALERRLELREEEAEKDRQRIRALERQGEHDRALIRRLASRLRAAVAQIRALGGNPAEEVVDALQSADERLELET